VDFVPPASDYDRYIRSERKMFHYHPERGSAAREATRGLVVERVLGAGQEIPPFVQDGMAFGVGIDLRPEVGRVGRELFAAVRPGARVTFGRAAAESLPFAAEVFDVVVSRVALPYSDNASALDEMARVLWPSGLLLLKIHHAFFYVRQMGQALPTGNVRAFLSGARVLVAGAIYHLTGHQPRTRIIGRETFQTPWLLRRELARRSLTIVVELPDTNWATPSLVIRKK
jgi:SAM-dependent methyltransferase